MDSNVCLAEDRLQQQHLMHSSLREKQFQIMLTFVSDIEKVEVGFVDSIAISLPDLRLFYLTSEVSLG